MAWDIYVEDIQRLKIKREELQKADAPGQRPIIYTQIAVLSEAFKERLTQAVREGLLDEVDFKTSFQVVDSVTMLLRCLRIVGVDARMDPEARKMVHAWKAAKKRGQD